MALSPSVMKLHGTDFSHVVYKLSFSASLKPYTVQVMDRSTN